MSGNDCGCWDWDPLRVLGPNLLSIIMLYTHDAVELRNNQRLVSPRWYRFFDTRSDLWVREYASRATESIGQLFLFCCRESNFCPTPFDRRLLAYIPFPEKLFRRERGDLEARQLFGHFAYGQSLPTLGSLYAIRELSGDRQCRYGVVVAIIHNAIQSSPDVLRNELLSRDDEMTCCMVFHLIIKMGAVDLCSQIWHRFAHRDPFIAGFLDHDSMHQARVFVAMTAKGRREQVWYEWPTYSEKLQLFDVRPSRSSIGRGMSHIIDHTMTDTRDLISIALAAAWRQRYDMEGIGHIVQYLQGRGVKDDANGSVLDQYAHEPAFVANFSFLLR